MLMPAEVYSLCTNKIKSTSILRFSTDTHLKQKKNWSTFKKKIKVITAAVEWKEVLKIIITSLIQIPTLYTSFSRNGGWESLVYLYTVDVSTDHWLRIQTKASGLCEEKGVTRPCSQIATLLNTRTHRDTDAHRHEYTHTHTLKMPTWVKHH